MNSMTRPLIAAAAALAFLAAPLAAADNAVREGVKHTAHAKVHAELVSIDFQGGSLKEYIEHVKKAAGDHAPNVVIM